MAEFLLYLYLAYHLRIPCASRSKPVLPWAIQNVRLVDLLRPILVILLLPSKAKPTLLRISELS
jgi:hypothetical protein